MVQDPINVFEHIQKQGSAKDPLFAAADRWVGAALLGLILLFSIFQISRHVAFIAELLAWAASNIFVKNQIPAPMYGISSLWDFGGFIFLCIWPIQLLMSLVNRPILRVLALTMLGVVVILQIVALALACSLEIGVVNTGLIAAALLTLVAAAVTAGRIPRLAVRQPKWVGFVSVVAVLIAFFGVYRWATHFYTAKSTEIFEQSVRAAIIKSASGGTLLSITRISFDDSDRKACGWATRSRAAGAKHVMAVMPFMVVRADGPDPGAISKLRPLAPNFMAKFGDGYDRDAVIYGCNTLLPPAPPGGSTQIWMIVPAKKYYPAASATSWVGFRYVTKDGFIPSPVFPTEGQVQAWVNAVGEVSAERFEARGMTPMPG